MAARLCCRAGSDRPPSASHPVPFAFISFARPMRYSAPRVPRVPQAPCYMLVVQPPAFFLDAVEVGHRTCDTEQGCLVLADERMDLTQECHPVPLCRGLQQSSRPEGCAVHGCGIAAWRVILSGVDRSKGNSWSTPHRRMPQSLALSAPGTTDRWSKRILESGCKRP